MSSLFEYLKNDRDNVLERISRSLVKKMYLPQQYHKDAMHECILSWMEADYDPFYDNDSIIAFAYNCARNRLQEWRRKNLMPVMTTRKENPEPTGVSIDDLFGDILDVFNDETSDPDPLDIMISELEAETKPEEKERKIEDVVFPDVVRGAQKHYPVMLKLLSEDHTYEEVAEILGINKRTIYRRMKELKNANLIEKV